MAKSGAGVINEVEPDVMQNISNTLYSIRMRDKPLTNEDIKRVLDEYFTACRDTGTRPGVEGVCWALKISRTTFNNWCQGIGCDTERKEIILNARQYVIACVEALGLSNKLNPGTWCFALKNWANWRDQPQQLEIVNNSPFTRSRDEILAGFNMNLLEESEDMNNDDI